MAKAQGIRLGYKIVRGAYMEKENDRAQEKGYPTPICANKKATDDNFDEVLKAQDIKVDVTVPNKLSESEEEEETNVRRSRTEADLRGSLNNDSLSEDEIKQIEADREKAEKAAELRIEDYQLAYAIDILKGLSALGPQD